MNEAVAQRVIFFAAGLLAGGGTAYFLTKKYMEDKIETIVDIEVAATKKFYEDKLDKQDRKEKTGDYSTPEKAAKKLRKANEEDLKNLRQQLVENGYVSETDIEEMDAKLEELGDLPDILVNDNTPGEEEDVEREHIIHDGETPYVITIVEYNEERMEYDKLTITYYSGDETLADEREEIIPDIEAAVGSDALTRFGDGSGDKNIVYVRNDRIATDMEVVLDPGSYARIVLGIEPPEKPKIRRMRDGD